MIRLETEGAVARITLDAPHTHNALDRGALAVLGGEIERAAATEGVRVLVLTGTGRSFCSGAKLDDVSTADWTENPLTQLCDRLERLDLPTVCALNGGVYGGGVEIALSCDFRIGVEGMRMFVPAARLGIHYPPEGLRRAERLLGLRATRAIFLLAESFDDRTLADLGFLDRLVPAEGLAAAVADLTARLSGLAPLAVQGMKRTLRELGEGTLDGDAARARMARCFASRDHAEGMAAQREKRPPRFTGR